jgi:hypothetical protein
MALVTGSAAQPSCDPMFPQTHRSLGQSTASFPPNLHSHTATTPHHSNHSTPTHCCCVSPHTRCSMIPLRETITPTLPHPHSSSVHHFPTAARTHDDPWSQCTTIPWLHTVQARIGSCHPWSRTTVGIRCWREERRVCHPWHQHTPGC